MKLLPPGLQFWGSSTVGGAVPPKVGGHVLRLQCQAHILAGGAEFVRVDGDHRKPAVVPAPGRFGHEVDARQVAQRLMVGFEDLPLAAHSFRQHPQLPATDGGEDVAQAVVVTDLGMLVVRRGVTGLGGQFPPGLGG